RGPGQREQVRELRVGHPALHADDLTVDLGQHGIRSADGDQGQRDEDDGQLHEGVQQRTVHSQPRQAATMPQGPRTSTTARSGQWSRPTPTKARPASSTARGVCRYGSATLMPVVSMRPAPAAATPRNAPRTRSFWPLRAYSTTRG